MYRAQLQWSHWFGSFLITRWECGWRSFVSEPILFYHVVKATALSMSSPPRGTTIDDTWTRTKAPKNPLYLPLRWPGVCQLPFVLAWTKVVACVENAVLSVRNKFAHVPPRVMKRPNNRDTIFFPAPLGSLWIRLFSDIAASILAFDKFMARNSSLEGESKIRRRFEIFLRAFRCFCFFFFLDEYPNLKLTWEKIAQACACRNKTEQLWNGCSWFSLFMWEE